MLHKRLYTGFLGCCIVAAFQGCVNEAPISKELQLGDSAITTTILVPVTGGTFFFNPKDIAHSAKITFPTNSYPIERAVTLKTTPISGSTFGDNINPVSALYSFDVGGDFTHNDITIDIPYTGDTSKFTMAFLYDPTTSDLEGVPTVGYFPTLQPSVFSVCTRKSGSIFLSCIAKSKLGNSATTSFDPTKDNWEFPNYPTFITPGGQFAGQTLSSLWYYYEKTMRGSSHLYGAFDSDHGGESPKLWQDNDLGLRVSAETQNTLDWNALSMIVPLVNIDALLTTEQVLYSILITGKPQLVAVVKDSTVLPLIVYKVENNTLFVADPNYPSIKSGTISAKDNAYQTTTSASSGGAMFEYATYIGVRAMVDWNTIGKIWSNAENNTFTTFPKQTISFRDSSGTLTSSGNGFVTLFNTVTLNIQSSGNIFVKIYQNGAFSEYDPTKGISLNPGINHIGVSLQNLSSNGNDTLWSGFSSFNIQE